ncbi:transketolase [Suillus clintonianus]|uniref:transketolase n=1 Tax=Suillus clintonianus TaxID=1904413 RepID=UPI001B884176|nr:transketolase [Suillus clintonianus]KAG2130271.1 transketolase [Suillus clintonianus]
MQAIDKIVNSTGKTYFMSGGNVPCPVVFRDPNGAASGVGAQHSQDYAAWYGSIPGLKVVRPWSAVDDCKRFLFLHSLLSVLPSDPNPVVFLENEMMYGVTFPMSSEAMSDNFTLPIGKAKVEREGADITIVAHSKMVTRSLEAADLLAKEGVKAEVINLCSICPLDIDTINLLIVEGGFPAFGVGSEICAQIIESEAFDYLDAPVDRVTGADVPTPYATNLEALAFPDTPLIVKVAKRALYRTN